MNYYYYPRCIDPNHTFAHYTDIVALKGMLNGVGTGEMCIWATSINCLYEQEELKISVKYTPEIKKIISEETYKNTYIISLCKNYNSSYMWEKYSKESKEKKGVILFLNISSWENVTIGHVLYDETKKCDENYKACENPLGIIHGDLDKDRYSGPYPPSVQGVIFI